MPVYQTVLHVPTRSRGLHDVTERVAEVVSAASISTGFAQVFVQHTSASLIVQENADPSVRADLERWASDLAPENRTWQHADEGPDDMPAHAKSTITGCSQLLPIRDGRLALGTWQALYLWEHRSQPHTRSLVVTCMGE